MSAKTRRDNVIKGAKHTISTPELLREHLVKTRQCFHGVKCKNKETCSGAHFLDEYRLPICLYLEFCQEKACKNFHPHLGKTKEQFMEESNINLPDRQLKSEECPLLPLVERNHRAVINTTTSTKANTVLCSFVKEHAKCKRSGCTFAHSVKDLVLSIATTGMSLRQKRETAERLMKKTIPDFFMKPSHMNSEYANMMKKQVEFIKELRSEENGDFEQKYQDDDQDDQDDDQDDKNIKEILLEIEHDEEEQAKEEFIAELDMLISFEEWHFAPDSEEEQDEDQDEDQEEEEQDEEEQDEDQDDQEEEQEEDIKVKIVVGSISGISNMEQWMKRKNDMGENTWGDMSDDEKW